MRQIAVFAALTVATLLAACGQTPPPISTQPSTASPAVGAGTSLPAIEASQRLKALATGNFNPNNFDTAKIMDAIRHPKPDLVTLSAHRGLHALVDGRYPGVPENSLEAIGLTAQAGLEMVEIDLKLTQDDIPILSHDTTWGRELCRATPLGGFIGEFDPFGSPSSNDSYNIIVSNWSLSYMRRGPRYAFQVDSIRSKNDGCNSFGGPYAPTLQEVLNYMRANKIAMVLSLDIRDASTASAAWAVIADNKDYLDRPYAASTVFKVGGKSYPTPAVFKEAFSYGPGYQAVNYIPVYNTSDIAPGTIAENLFGGVDVPLGASGFGSEEGIMRHLSSFEEDPTINIVAVEVNQKESGGILLEVAGYARRNQRTHEPESLGIFSPYVDYYAPGDTAKTDPLFFKTNGYCCVRLSDFYYNGKPNGQDSDTHDYRPSFAFVIGSGFNTITTDNPEDYDKNLKAIPYEKRNISYMQSSTGTGNNNRDLRILTVGDSITYGYGNGDTSYRRSLKDRLTGEGHNVEYVGTQVSGPDGFRHEGYPGAQINGIRDAVTSDNAVKRFAPNLILLMAGTNDVGKPFEPSTAPGRLGALIDQITADAPDSVVLVAKITPWKDQGTQALANAFNAQVPGIVQSRIDAGKHVRLVDMSGLTQADLSDNVHPNDGGYQKMAAVWDAGIAQVANDIRLAAACGSTADGCAPGGANGSRGAPKPAPGLGKSTLVSDFATGIGAPAGSTVQFVDLDGDGKNDYAALYPDGRLEVYRNLGHSGTKWDWVPIKTPSVIAGVGAPGPSIRLADLNGDRRAEYIVVNPDGSCKAWLNGGPNPNGVWIWIPYANDGKICNALGFPPAWIQFADIDNNGKADYLAVNPDTGAVTAYLNMHGWLDDMGWVPAVLGGVIATGVGAPPGTAVQFADINNDGYADYLTISSRTGAVSAWLNQGKNASNPNKWDWFPPGQVFPGDGAPTRNHQIQLADINEDGRADYLSVDTRMGAVRASLSNGLDTTPTAVFDSGWLKLGDISVPVKPVGGPANATGYSFADLTGDGLVDYVTTDTAGDVTAAYLKTGAGWDIKGAIAHGVAGVGKNIQFADINGDGKADYLVIDPKTGAVQAWISGGPNSESISSWNWPFFISNFVTGVGADTSNTHVQFADINGDKRADYLVVGDDGTVRAWLNGGQSAVGWKWDEAAKFVTGVGIDPKAFRSRQLQSNFADINGDGLADYLVVNDGGAVSAWISGGQVPGGWKWDPRGQITNLDIVSTFQKTPGATVFFGDVNGDGRDDYLLVGDSGIVTAWQNNGGN